MIIVTGSKRSGTSMWMQILKQAGFPVLGRRFPRDWAETIRAANREGFYETRLRHGIYHRTNPNPRTGVFLAPAQTRRTVVKVFAPGLSKSDLAYIDFVIATVREPREYRMSIERLYRIEHESKLLRAARQGRPVSSVPRLSFAPPALEWWNDTYTMLRDARLRGYRVKFVSYAAALRDRERLVGEVLAWLGTQDKGTAARAIQAALYTQRASDASLEPSGLSPRHEALCQELYARIDREQAIDDAFMTKLARAHAELKPRIEAAERAARARLRERERTRTHRMSGREAYGE